MPGPLQLHSWRGVATSGREGGQTDRRSLPLRTWHASPGPGRRVLTQTRRVRDSVTPIGLLAYFYERRDFLLSDSGARVHGLLPVCLCSLDRACSVVLTEGG